MRRIVIVGGGFSGTLLSVHLLRRAHRGDALHLTLIERDPSRLGRGVAYSTPHQACLLNVPAGRMSAFEDDKDHFVRWAALHDPAITGATFVPRGMYGDYLTSLLNEARAGADPHSRLDQVVAEAVEIDDPPSPGQARIRLSDGRRLDADRVVIALGNFPPRDPPGADGRFLAGPRYTRNPWAAGALEKIPISGPILLLGTGLTMLDVALVLRDLGHESALQAVSRRGLLPQPHRVSTTPPQTLPFPDSMRMDRPTPAKLLRALRKEIEVQARLGNDWREVVTALRNDTADLWQSLDIRGKRQFLRHLLPFWETHRHRAAPATAAAIQTMCADGQLVVGAGRILQISEDSRDIKVWIHRRGRRESEQIQVSHLINCTGPDTDLMSVGGPLLRSAIARGLIKPDELGLGLDVAQDGAVIRADGTLSHRLFAIGPLRKAQLWETTAVPELRLQAADLAGRLQAGR